MMQIADILSDTRIGRRMAKQLTKPDRRTGSRVHRNTKMRVGEEGELWQAPPNKFGVRLMRRLERFEDEGLKAEKAAKTGAKEGPIGSVGLRVARYLLWRLNRETGRLDPAVKTIAAAIGRRVGTVHAALKRLRACGFLLWERRFEETGLKGLRGPQVRQASNAYRLILPVEQLAKPDWPRPVDDEHRRAVEAAEIGHMVDRLPPDERPGALCGDRELGDLINDLGRAVAANERDSDQRNDSLHKKENSMMNAPAGACAS